MKWLLGLSVGLFLGSWMELGSYGPYVGVVVCTFVGGAVIIWLME